MDKKKTNVNNNLDVNQNKFIQSVIIDPLVFNDIQLFSLQIATYSSLISHAKLKFVKEINLYTQI